jgi:hypothetical protein
LLPVLTTVGNNGPFQYRSYLYFTKWSSGRPTEIWRTTGSGTELECIFTGDIISFRIYDGHLYVLTPTALIRAFPDGTGSEVLINTSNSNFTFSLGSNLVFDDKNVFINAQQENTSGIIKYDLRTGSAEIIPIKKSILVILGHI